MGYYYELSFVCYLFAYCSRICAWNIVLEHLRQDSYVHDDPQIDEARIMDEENVFVVVGKMSDNCSST